LRARSADPSVGLRGLPRPPREPSSKLNDSAYLLPLGVSFRVPAAAGMNLARPAPSSPSSFLPRASSPLRRSPPGASTPAALRRAHLRQRGTTRHCSFHPRGLSPPRRLSPHRASEHVAARAGHGVRRVSAPLDRLRRASRCTRPRDAHTPRRSPLISSRSASLRPLPSCRFYLRLQNNPCTLYSSHPFLEGPRLQGLAPPTSP
jgi:hypothetical protein